MLPYRDSRITKIALVAFFILIAAYTYFEARGILWGPSIEIAQHTTDATSSYIQLTGTTSHIASLSMNGQSVPVTEAGAFDIPFALSPGYNRIVFDAKDTYGHSTERVVEIVYTPSATSAPATSTPLEAASSTATSTLQ